MLIRNMKDNGKMINKMDQGHIIGLMVRFNTKSSKIFIKVIGLMDKEKVSDVFTIQMDVDFKVTLIEIRKMVWE